MSTPKNRKLVEEVEQVMDQIRYSIHTERTCCNWIKRYVSYHQMLVRDDLMKESEAKIEAFLIFLIKPPHRLIHKYDEVPKGV